MTLFPTVTGRMFGRSNKWAKRQPRLRTLIMKPKLIQKAVFAAGAGGGLVRNDEFAHLNSDVIRGATVEIGTILFESARPTSAANADFINRVCEEACK